MIDNKEWSGLLKTPRLKSLDFSNLTEIGSYINGG